jgi:hypothetical protein
MNALNAATGAFGQGLGAMGQGSAWRTKTTNALISGGQLNQQDQQGQLNADFQRWQGNDTRQNDLLNRYWASSAPITGAARRPARRRDRACSRTSSEPARRLRALSWRPTRHSRRTFGRPASAPPSMASRFTLTTM